MCVTLCILIILVLKVGTLEIQDMFTKFYEFHRVKISYIYVCRNYFSGSRFKHIVL